MDRATVKLYHSGISAGIPPIKPTVGIRGDVSGWSPAVSRRCIAWLRRVQHEELTGTIYAFTLTVRDCPPSASAWHSVRRALHARLFRAGAVRWHWCTEWQARGVPHLHGVICFPDSGKTGEIINAWLSVAAVYRAGRKGQNVKPCDVVRGWLQYLAKHIARGVYHYQRSKDNIPPSWHSKTGRMWGYGGDWPLADVGVIPDIPLPVFYSLRRIYRRRALADVRARRPVVYRDNQGGFSLRPSRGCYPLPDVLPVGSYHAVAAHRLRRNWRAELQGARRMLRRPTIRYDSGKINLHKTRALSAVGGISGWCDNSLALLSAALLVREE